MPLIQTFIPYADDRNLGRAHNEAMSLLPEAGWGCILDHDVMFTTPEWHRQMQDAVAKRPEGCFSGVTNRIKCPYQLVTVLSESEPRGYSYVDSKNHDYAYHREVGRKVASGEVWHEIEDVGTIRRDGLLDITENERERTPAGFLMLLSKAAWREAGGFPEGLHYMDRMMWLALKLAGRRIYIIEGLYLYHWHRGAGEAVQQGEWVVEHTIADGKKLKLAKKREELPVYTG